MATLTRTATQQEQPVDSLLTSSIPAPFPRELLQQPSPAPTIAVEAHAVEAGPSRTSEANSPMVLQELMPSIAYVEKTCLMTLNNLLSGPTAWNPIVPDRRHSMPSTPVTSTSTDPSSSALQTLLANLRNRDPPDAMVEIHGSSDTALIHELHNRVAQMSHTLEPSDAHLAESIVSLLSHFNRLSSIRATDQSARLTPLEDRADEPLYPPGDLFNTLKRQLSDLQVERQSQQEPLAPNTPPVVAVEKALLWSKIDEELEAVVAMCKERTERLEHLPPQYDVADYQLETPPQYDSASIRSSHDEKPNGLQSPTLAAGSEKMRLDLEAVAMAIDRLYLVAPQLHNQRVELKSSKLAQMEKARRQGPASAAAPASAVSRGKQKEKDPDTRDLENMLELIGRASERTLKDQSVILDGGMKTRLERARQRDVVKREAFVGHLADYSDAGRLHGQDAVLQPTGARTKNPDAMLTLPEFIREGVPDGVRLEDPKAMLTLPEFVKEALPSHVNPSPPTAPASAIRKKPIRTRSMSAPSMSWLRRPSSRSGLRSEVAGSTSAAPSVSESEAAFSVTYIAEHHENLQHILVFLTVRGATPGVDIEAEVLPAGGDAADAGSGSGGDYLVVKSGAHTSLPLVLPGRTAPGKQHVRVQGAHYELKLATAGAGAAPADTHAAPLLDATQLATAAPTSFICASCSLPVVQSAARVREYRDLPSEHWEELVDAWMCHADQKLNARVMKHGRGGFWPEEGQALVGGSYILFEEEAMVKHHLCPADETKRGEDWRLVRCICGAVVGRCQEHQAGSGNANANVFRMLKYAIRPVSSATEPSKLPLSAFIVEDMTEFVDAHASYRFIILDEEEERARILVWLFKPHMRLAYTTQTQYALPRSASIRTAKVLYKLLGPSEAAADLPSILSTYPGFPQAEYLFYPMDICRRLAGLLKESNGAYPESLRTMTGLEVGWLRRA
ncbi:HECT-like ubiquitin-conjugating enzyme-binding-domain-containing protein [Mycena olivaceomarginata]|nr:HECT-like ubiquitin-conjugating enzyme-binding-domain-containing protein [Mycena olivaceomarginata]